MAKSKPTMSLVSRSVHRSPTLDSGVSYSPGHCGMQSQNADRSREDILGRTKNSPGFVGRTL